MELTPRSSAPGRTARDYRVLAIPAVALFVLNALRYRGYLLDDTFISLRYARNLVEGHGLVFNVGERVEGYSNFLYVLLAALFGRLGLDPLTATAWVSIASAAGLLLVLARTERLLDRLDGRSAPVSIPRSLLLLLPLPAFAYWSVVSMETMLFAALLAWAIHLSLVEWESGRLCGSAAVFVLLSLTRPEGLFLFAVCTGLLVLLEWKQRRSAAHLWRHMANTGLYAVGFGTYFLWRWSYYGALLPNTFQAKVTGGPEQWTTGLTYLKGVLFAFPLLLLAIPLTLLFPPAGSRGDPTSRTALRFVAWIALVFLIYTVGVGGDFMPYYRFFLPVLPLACLLAARWLRSTRALATVLAVSVIFGVSTDAPVRAFVAHRTALAGEHVGDWMRANLAPDDLIAVNTAGAVPYHSRLRAIDMLGLTDENIAGLRLLRYSLIDATRRSTEVARHPALRGRRNGDVRVLRDRDADRVDGRGRRLARGRPIPALDADRVPHSLALGTVRAVRNPARLPRTERRALPRADRRPRLAHDRDGSGPDGARLLDRHAGKLELG